MLTFYLNSGKESNRRNPTDIEISGLSRSPPCGAGLVLFFYPLAEQEGALRAALGRKLGDSATILGTREYLERYYLDETVWNSNRIGGLVAIAQDESFPARGGGHPQL